MGPGVTETWSPRQARGRGGGGRRIEGQRRRAPSPVSWMNLDLGLHAPVAELHLAELVGAHDGECLLPVLSIQFSDRGPRWVLVRWNSLGSSSVLYSFGGHWGP